MCPFFATSFIIKTKMIHCLGPKVNHHFRANNSILGTMEHPRWGLIMTITPTRDIKSGEEIFIYYGYENERNSGEFPIDYPWYWDQKMALEKDERLKHKTEKKKIKKQKQCLSVKDKKVEL